MSQRRRPPSLSEAELVERARAALTGRITLEQDGPVSVTRHEGRHVVEFGRVNAAGERGPDFEARVTLDHAGNVLEVLAGS